MRHLLAAASLLAVLCACEDEPRTREAAIDVDATEAELPVRRTAEATTEAEAGVGVTLTALDCGTVEALDLGLFSGEGVYEGEQDTFADSCWLVRHPEGTLLWDTGLPAALAGQGRQVNGPFAVTLERPLADQLRELGVRPGFVALSHSHFDHSGQPEAAGRATWLVTDAELRWMEDNEGDPEVDAAGSFTAFLDLDTESFSGERDVFGDGTVRIVEMPGHTPGHAVLLVTLDEEGPVLLTGDMYHLDRARELKTVPVFNWDGDATRDSIEAFEALAEETGARVIIQHEDADVADLYGTTLR